VTEEREHDELGHDIERRAQGGLSEQQFRELRALVHELVREAVAELPEQVKRAVLSSIFEDVGRGAVSKILSGFGYLLIVVFIAVLAFFVGKEHINFH
jgi:hypothetical protein